MTRDELIDKIEDLYEQLLDRKYDDWYNSSTLTPWEDSFRHKEWNKLYTEKQELISQIEISF